LRELSTQRRLRPGTVDLSLMAALFTAKLALHLALGGRYGYNGDELYFIACGRHLAFGYVDHAPLVPWVARLAGWLFESSLVGLRLFPALAGAVSVVLTALIAREWGGRRFAQVCAALAVLIAPSYLRMGSILCIPAFELLFWTLGAYLVVLCIRRDEPRLWLAIGLVAGLGLLNKHTMLLWGAGMFAGLLLTPERVRLRSPWLWAGAALAFLLFLPNLLWQAHNDWATLEFIRNINRDQLDGIPRGLFLLGQFVYMHPITLPLVPAGLVFFFSGDGKAYRLFGWLFLVVLGILFLNHAKPYYLAPAYPPVFAAGAVVLERWLRRLGLRWAPAAVILGMLAGGVALGLVALPLLPLESTDRFIQRMLGFAVPDPAMLTLEFHEQYGWPEQARMVAEVYRSLPPDEQKAALILAHDYAQASAIDFFGKGLGLPPVVSGHMSYFLWGPPQTGGEVVIACGMPLPDLEPMFSQIQLVAILSHPLASAWERGVPVYLCRQPRMPLKERWPALKRYFFRQGAGPGIERR
jgi:4-amino-4-deoxy-L-arabinose transferase-like glycosyltransferase